MTYMLRETKCRYSWMHEFCTKIFRKQCVSCRMHRYFQLSCACFQREPSMIATGNMIALRPRMSTLAFFNASKLLQLTVYAFNIPSNTISITYGISCRCICHIIRDKPINVTVFGNYLEKPHIERYIFYPYDNTLLKLLV